MTGILPATAIIFAASFFLSFFLYIKTFPNSHLLLFSPDIFFGHYSLLARPSVRPLGLSYRKELKDEAESSSMNARTDEIGKALEVNGIG
jgi:hypothetical protein